MITQRFNGPDEWNNFHYNFLYKGMIDLLIELKETLPPNTSKTMIEIGSYM
jgi:hypothetical protein